MLIKNYQLQVYTITWEMLQNNGKQQKVQIMIIFQINLKH